MSAALDKPALWRSTAWTVIAALLLPTIVACTAPPPAAPSAPPRSAPDVARLDGIVADGSRAVQGREAGWVIVTRDGVRQDAYAGLELRRGDFVETGPRAHAVIRYPSGTELLMRPSSGGRVGSLTEFFGEVFVKVKGLFSVDTTFVKAGARGTAYLVRTYAGGTTGITVVEGAVEVGSTTNAWPSVTIGAGTMTLAHPRAPQPMAASLEELARTRDWVDRVEQLVPARSGVSTGVVVGAVAIAALIAAMAASSGNDRPRETPPQPEPRRDPPPPPPRAPDAPRAIGPGVAQGAQPTFDCRRGVELRWAQSAGARDYAAVLEVARERNWRAVNIAPTAATQVVVVAQLLGDENRWWVRARGAGESAPSQTLYFRCDFTGVR